MSASASGVIVTKLHRAEHGELEARVSVGGDTVPVTRADGSWQIERGDGGWIDVLHEYAALLQQKARRFERHERGCAVE